jgi:large subunit ribosomal protein L30
MAKKFSVKLIKSIIGCTETQIATINALGIKSRGKSVVVNDNPANRGQIRKIQHLVEVEIQR